MDLCGCKYNQEVIQGDKVNGWQDSISNYLALMMTTLEFKKILKLNQAVKDAQDGWSRSSYPSKWS